MSGALAALEKAAALEPGNARYSYVYAIALNGAGRSGDAIALLKKARDRYPADVDILSALVTLSRDSGDGDAAISHVKQLIKAAPPNADAQALSRSLRPP